MGSGCILRYPSIRSEDLSLSLDSCFILEEPIAHTIDLLVGVWSLSYTNGHTDQCTITPDGLLTITSNGLQKYLEASDEEILFHSSDGWLMVENNYLVSGGNKEYYRFNETHGTLQVVHFCGNKFCSLTYKGLEQFCCYATGIMELDITRRPGKIMSLISFTINILPHCNSTYSRKCQASHALSRIL